MWLSFASEMPNSMGISNPSFLLASLFRPMMPDIGRDPCSPLQIADKFIPSRYSSFEYLNRATAARFKTWIIPQKYVRKIGSNEAQLRLVLQHVIVLLLLLLGRIANETGNSPPPI